MSLLGEVSPLVEQVSLSPRYPTIAVRVAHAWPTVEDAVLLIALVRALVAALADDVWSRIKAIPAPPAFVRALAETTIPAVAPR